MSDFQIIIKGLALCQQLKDTTEILFPHGPGHNLILTIESENKNRIVQEITPETHMTMTRENGVTVKPPDVVRDHLIDLSTLHDVFGLPELELKARGNIRGDIGVSFLSVPSAMINSKEDAGTTFELWVKEKPLLIQAPKRTYKGLAPFGGSFDQEVIFTFDIPPGDFSDPPAINLNIASPYDHLFTFPHLTSGGGYTLTFDNHCNGKGCGADFGYYYEILEAKLNNTLYEVEEFYKERPDKLMEDTESACNPAKGPKPAGGGGFVGFKSWHEGQTN